MNFIIDYTILRADKTVLKVGQIIVKNKLSEIQAKVMLEEYLRKKHPEFGFLIVNACLEHTEMRDMLNDIFGKNIFT
jgi:hypothetical protein